MTWMAINGDQMKVPATQGVRYLIFATAKSSSRMSGMRGTR